MKFLKCLLLWGNEQAGGDYSKIAKPPCNSRNS